MSEIMKIFYLLMFLGISIYLDHTE